VEPLVDEELERPHQRIEEVSILSGEFHQSTSLKKGEINTVAAKYRAVCLWLASALCARMQCAVT
jgi:hypothetical protein